MPHILTYPARAAAAAEAFERRRKRLEEDAARREAEIREFQRAHWREMKDAAARNRAAIMAEVRARVFVWWW